MIGRLRTKGITAIAIALLACGSLSAGSITYNVTTQWSNSSNPNGTWSYDQGVTPLPFQASLGTGTCYNFLSGIGGGYAPGGNTGNCLPAAFQATGTSGFGSNAYVTGDVIVASQDPTNGPGEGQASIIWTAPTTGAFTYTGAIWWAGNPSNPRSNDFVLDEAATTLSSGTVTSTQNRSNMVNFSSNTPTFITAGETIELIVSKSAGQSFGSFSGVQLSITELPEPSTGLMLVPGLLAAFMLRKKLRRS
jgi:hypothetical protein